MELSAREIQVIEVLLRHPEGLTAGDIASRLGVRMRGPVSVIAKTLAGRPRPRVP